MSAAELLSRDLVVAQEREEGSSYYAVKPDLSHDVYINRVQGARDYKEIELSVRRTGREDCSDLQIEIKITTTRDNRGTGRRDYSRVELGSFTLPASMAKKFILSCSEVVE